MLRAAIVGSGYIARVHALLLEQMGVSVAGVCGRTLAGANSLKKGQAYDNLPRMLAELRPDVVHICTPNSLHAEQAMLALRADAHVICEKPLTTRSDDARSLRDEAARRGRVGGVAYCYRGYSVIQQLVRDVAAGKFGALRRVSGLYLSHDLFDAGKYSWHFTGDFAGPSYVGLDYGIHWLDLVEFATGKRFSEIAAQFTTHQPTRVWHGRAGEGPRPDAGRPVAEGIEVDVRLEEQIDLIFRMSGGAGGSATFFNLSPGNPNHIVLSLDGSKAGFDWCQEAGDNYVERLPDIKVLRHRDPARLPQDLSWHSPAGPGHPEGYLDAFRNTLIAIYKAIQGESVVYPSFADGLRGVHLIERTIESARAKRAVSIDAV